MIAVGLGNILFTRMLIKLAKVLHFYVRQAQGKDFWDPAMTPSIRKALLGMLAGAAASGPLALSIGRPSTSVFLAAVAMTQLSGSPFATGNGPISVAVDPTGKFAYVANQKDSNVSAYRIGADGSLT